MANRMEETRKIAGRVTEEVNQEIDAWAEKLGMGKTAFVSLCIMAGLKQVIRVVSPEEAISPETILKVIKAAEDQGLQVQGFKKD